MKLFYEKNTSIYILLFFDILENLIFSYEILRKIYKSWNSEMKLFYDSIIKKYIISKFYNLKKLYYHIISLIYFIHYIIYQLAYFWDILLYLFILKYLYLLVFILFAYNNLYIFHNIIFIKFISLKCLYINNLLTFLSIILENLIFKYLYKFLYCKKNYVKNEKKSIKIYTSCKIIYTFFLNL